MHKCWSRGLLFLWMLFASLSALAAIGTTTISPATGVVGVPVTITVTSQITDPTVLPSSVNLQQLNASGAAVSVVGYLNDAGTGCDAVAGDQIYTICATVTPTATGPFSFRVSAAQNGKPLRIYSSTVSVAVAATATVPNVVGLTQAVAGTTLKTATLTTGPVTTAASSTVPAGAVISQNPVAGTVVATGSSVALVVSTGPATVVVPNVVGLTQAAAGTALSKSTLTTGTVTTAASSTVAAGNVISQTPVAGTLVAPGSAVALVVSTGSAPVTVPNVVGLTQAAAGTALTTATLTTGTITTAASSTVAAGNVISQTPVAGSLVAPGSAVALVVSSGVAKVLVPNVVGLTQAAAGTTLSAATLTTGTITTAPSSTVAAGSVISQSPVAGTLVAPGSGVALVISTGPATVAVPNVVGLTQAAAGTALTTATLTTGTVTTAASSTVAAGSVISQSPAAGTLVAPGSAVALVVSTGVAKVSVPNVVGLTQAAAGTSLSTATLTTGTVTTAPSSTVAAGSVISQSPVAGTLVAPGTAVALLVSSGPASVTVPNVVGLTQAAAGTTLTGATLTTGTITTAASATVASGLVISQSPLAGTSVATGTAVALVISAGPAPVTVPNVVGLTQTGANNALTLVSLVTGTVTTASSATVPSGNVISQSPVAGTAVATGSAVAIVVSSGPQQVQVPNVLGFTQTAASTAITGATLSPGTVTQAPSPTAPVGTVVSQTPAPLTLVSPGSTVSLVLSSGPATTPLNLSMSLAPAVSPTFQASQTITGTINGTTTYTPPSGGGTATLATTSGLQGQTLNVTINGVGTSFATGVTQVSFGLAVTVNSVTVLSPTQATANITIAPTSATGPLLVTVSTGAQQLTTSNVFNILTGQGVVTGSLVSQGGTAIAGAQVCAADNSVCTTSTSTGSFTLSGVSATITALNISATGYVTLSDPIVVQVNSSTSAGVVALASSGLLPPPVAPPGSPTVTAGLASALGRGASQLNPGTNLSSLAKLVQDTIVAVGGSEGGVFDVNGNQLNSAVSGAGTVSLADIGTQSIAESLAVKSTTTLGKVLGGYLLALNYGTVTPPSLASVIAALQSEINAAWANSSKSDAPLLYVLFNQGYTVTVKPPTVSAGTPLSALQAYLLKASLMAFTTDLVTHTATASVSLPTRLAELDAGLRQTLVDVALPAAVHGRIVLAQATTPTPTPPTPWYDTWANIMAVAAPKVTIGLGNGSVSLGTTSSTTDFVSSLITTANAPISKAGAQFSAYLQSNGYISATNAAALNGLFSTAGFQAGVQYFQQLAVSAAKGTSVAAFTSEYIQNELSAVQGKVVDLIFGLEVNLIVSSLQPQAPFITSAVQLTDDNGNPTPFVAIDFQRSLNDNSTTAAGSNQTWWYTLYRQNGGDIKIVASGRPGTAGPGPFIDSTSSTNLYFYDLAPPGTNVYRILARRLIGTIPESPGYSNFDAAIAVAQGYLGSVETAGGYSLPGVSFVQQILSPAAQILDGIKFQTSPLSDPQSVFVASVTPNPLPQAEMAVDRDRNLTYLSIPDASGITASILSFQNGQPLATTISTGFTPPYQEGLGIDAQGKLYCDNGGSDALYGGRIFSFTPSGSRAFVGSASYYSMLLGYAQAVSVQALAVGPGPQGETLYVADQVSGNIGRIYPTYLPAGFDRNVAQPWVNIPQLFGNGPPILTFRGDGTMFAAQGTQIFEISPDGSSIQPLFDPASAPSPFFAISGITFDSESNLYVSDAGSGNITKVPLLYQTPHLGLAGLSSVALSKLVVANGYTNPARVNLSPDGRGLVFYDQNNGYYLVPFGMTGQVLDGSGNPVPNATLVVANRNINTVTDANGVYVLPGLLGSGETSVDTVTITNGGLAETFQVSLDPLQQNLQDFTFAPSAPTTTTPSGTPTPSNPTDGPPIVVHGLTGTTTVVSQTVTVPKLLTPGVTPPPPPPTSAVCKLRGLILSPGDGMALTGSSVTVSGFVSDPTIPAGALTLLVNGVPTAAPLVNGQFSVAGVALGEGNNTLTLAVTTQELKTEGCLPAGVPAGTSLIPISRVTRVFHDPSSATVASVAAARGFDTAVTGRLIDSDTQRPVVGLTIQATTPSGATTTAVTDFDGVFELRLLNAALTSTGTAVQSVPDTGLVLNVTPQ